MGNSTSTDSSSTTSIVEFNESIVPLLMMIPS